MKHYALYIYLLFIAATIRVNGQDSLFITRTGAKLKLDTSRFYAIGVNSYFLQNLAAYGDSAHLEEIFQDAKLLGINTIRTWGFYDSPDSTDPAVIQLFPGKFNEHALVALDRVIAKAKEYSIRIIISTVNNWEDYGGMNQYVRWRAGMLPLSKGFKLQQKIITGALGRSYHYLVSGAYTHDDFYTDSTIRQWYKNYLSMLLNRTNTITNIQYKKEPMIAAWELANEPRSSDPTGNIVANWLEEMSSYIKSIDQNHLVADGEEGFDTSSTLYSGVQSYNNQAWLFDGTAGTSFKKNTSVNNIDIASIHCYTEYWGLTPNQGVQWLSDHNRIAENIGKPIILGEVGKRNQPNLFFTSIFDEAYYSTTTGVLLWEFVYSGRPSSDGLAFSYPKDSAICNIVKLNAERFRQKSLTNNTDNNPMPTLVKLFQNFPNPFNSSTIISFQIPSRTFVSLKVYDMLGREVANLIFQEMERGKHSILWNASGISSGTYFYRLTADNHIDTKKLLLLR